jgi:hypothetical protein
VAGCCVSVCEVGGHLGVLSLDLLAKGGGWQV